MSDDEEKKNKLIQRRREEAMATADGRAQSLDLNLNISCILHNFDLLRINAFLDYISTCLIYATMHFYLEEKINM